jgi:hypothetical protein
MRNINPLELDPQALGEFIQDVSGGGWGEGQDDAGAAGAPCGVLWCELF